MRDFFGSFEIRGPNLQYPGVEDMQALFMNLQHVALNLVECKQAWKRIELLGPFRNLQSLTVVLPPYFDDQLEAQKEEAEKKWMRNTLEQGIKIAWRSSPMCEGRVGNLEWMKLPKTNFALSCELNSWIHAGR